MAIKEIDTDIERFVKSHAMYIVEYEKFSFNNQAALSKIERLKLVFAICSEMELAATGTFAKLQIDTALNVVEDVFCGVPFAPIDLVNDGRMYPAQEDYRRRTNFEHIATYEHRSHYSNFGRNGSINIHTKKGGELFNKAGADGLTVGDLRELTTTKISSSSS